MNETQKTAREQNSAAAAKAVEQRKQSNVAPLTGCILRSEGAGTMNDPRGPVRTILAIAFAVDGTTLTLYSGHTADVNQVFTYKIHATTRCSKCWLESDEAKELERRRLEQRELQRRLYA